MSYYEISEDINLTVDAGISKQSAIFWYSSLTLLKPDIMPVGLPCANWQWNKSFGSSRFLLLLDFLATGSSYLFDESIEGVDLADELAFCDAVDGTDADELDCSNEAFFFLDFPENSGIMKMCFFLLMQ